MTRLDHGGTPFIAMLMAALVGAAIIVSGTSTKCGAPYRARKMLAPYSLLLLTGKFGAV
jgi:hypothetical protein